MRRVALRAGLIGLGMMGRNHARVLRSMPDVTLVAVADSAGDPAGVAGGVPVVTDVDRLLGFGLDLCVVATPTDSHEETATALLEAGVHTLVEKPLAADFHAGSRLVLVAERSGRVAAVGHIERHNPAIRSLKLRLGDGALGEVYQVATSRQGPFPNRVRDVGVVKDLATHDFDLTAWVTGSHYVRVGARTATRAGRLHEDLVTAVASLADGTITNHVVNWMTPVKERRVVVTGERGSFVADTLTADLTFSSNGSMAATWDAISRFRGVSEGDIVRYAIPKPEPLQEELEQFCAAVRGEPAEVVSMAEGLRSLRVAEALLESARTDAMVSLEGCA